MTPGAAIWSNAQAEGAVGMMSNDTDEVILTENNRTMGGENMRITLALPIGEAAPRRVDPIRLETDLLTGAYSEIRCSFVPPERRLL